MASKIDLTVSRGDNASRVFTVKNSKGKPIDIGSWSSFIMTIDPSAAPVDSTNNVGSSVGSLNTTGIDGKFKFPLLDTIAAGNYFYDIQCLNDDGKVQTIVTGKYTVLQDITK